MYIRPLLAKSFSSLIFSGIIRCDPPSAGIFSYRPFADSVAVFTTILKNAENVNVFQSNYRIFQKIYAIGRI
jgi:hypothetical protein